MIDWLIICIIVISDKVQYKLSDNKKHSTVNVR